LTHIIITHGLAIKIAIQNIKALDAYSSCCYAECFYAECHYTECFGIVCLKETSSR
jgi:hypothetical protein